MIVGLGIDLVELDRIEKSLRRFSLRFAEKLLHPDERVNFAKFADPLSPGAVAHLAARFAAKEAAVKALGTGFAQGIILHDVRVLSRASGQPDIFLHNLALARADELGVVRTHLSLSHARKSACAVVVLESD